MAERKGNRASPLGRFAALAAVAVAASMILNGSSWSFGAIARSFATCSVYSLCVGGLAYVSLTKLGPRYGKLRAPWNWTLFLLACVVLAVVGCLLSDGALVLLGILPRAGYWAMFQVD